MLRQIVLPAGRIASIAMFVCVLLCLTAQAQKVTLTIKCETPDAQKTKLSAPEKPIKADKSKSPKFELKQTGTPDKVATKNSELGSQAGVITKGCIAGARVTAGPSATHANQIVLFNIAQTDPILKLRKVGQTTWVNTIQVWISLDNTGFGQSEIFEVLGENLGTTTLSAESPGFDGSELNIIVVECNCPIIPVSSPPRS